MTNYPITGFAENHISQQVRTLLNRRVDMLECGFPLTPDEVVKAVTPAWAREMLTKLKQHGVTSIQTTNNFSAVVDLIEYPVLLNTHLRGRQEFYCFAEQSAPHYATNHLKGWGGGGKDENQLPFDVKTLGVESRAKLKDWLALVTRETRFATLTKLVLGQFLTDHCPTLYHLMARWPDLRWILANADDTWRNRIDDVPIQYKLRRWGWNELNENDTEWRDGYQPVMDLASEILVSGQMLQQPVKNEDPVRAVVSGWKVKEKWDFAVP